LSKEYQACQTQNSSPNASCLQILEHSQLVDFFQKYSVVS